MTSKNTPNDDMELDSNSTKHDFQGTEKLLFNIYQNLEAMGIHRPKTCKKLEKSLKKWKKVASLCDLTDLLSYASQNDYVTIHSKLVTAVSLKEVEKKFCFIIKQKSKIASNIIFLRNPEFSHHYILFESSRKELQNTIPCKWSSMPSNTSFQQVVDQVLQKLQVHVNGGRRNPTDIGKVATTSIIDHVLEKLQVFGYISESSGNITYNLPSPFIIKILKSLKKEVIETQKRELNLGFLPQEKVLCDEIENCNSKLEDLKSTFDKNSDYYRMCALKEAVDVLHNRKEKISCGSGDGLYVQDLFIYSRFRPITGASSRTMETSCSRSTYSGSSHSGSDIESDHDSDKSISNNNICNITDSSDVLDNANNQTDNNVTSTNVSQKSTQSMMRKRTASFESNSSDTARHGKQRCFSPHSHREHSSDTEKTKRALEKKLHEDLIFQSELVSQLLGLTIVENSILRHATNDTGSAQESSTKKCFDQFNELINSMKTLSVDTIVQIPDNLDMETIHFIDVLDTMAESKPKNLQGMKNALHCTCNFLYVLHPKTIIQSQKIGRRDYKNEKIPIGKYPYQERIQLSPKDLFQKKIMVNQIDFSHNIISARKKTPPNHNPRSVYEVDRGKKNYDVFSKLLHNRLNFQSAQLGTTYILSSVEHEKLPKFKIWAKNLNKQHYSSRKQIYEELACYCVATKTLTSEYLVSLLEKEGVLKIKLDGSVFYNDVFDDNDSVSNLEPLYTGNNTSYKKKLEQNSEMLKQHYDQQVNKIIEDIL